MSGPFHPTGRARVSGRYPEAIGVCQKCGFWWQRRELRNQRQYQGLQLQALNIWVCPPCYDTPQPQLRTIILPPDPLPVWMPFPEPYEAEVPSNMTTLEFLPFATMDGVSSIVMMREITPTPNPNQPYLIPADF